MIKNRRECNSRILTPILGDGDPRQSLTIDSLKQERDQNDGSEYVGGPF